MDKQDGLASIQEDKVSPRREERLNWQEKSSEAFYPSSSPPTKAFYLSSPAIKDEEGEVALEMALAALKRHSQDQSSISSSDLSSSSNYISEEEFLEERGDPSLPEWPQTESSSNNEEVRERKKLQV